MYFKKSNKFNLIKTTDMYCKIETIKIESTFVYTYLYKSVVHVLCLNRSQGLIHNALAGV